MRENDTVLLVFSEHSVQSDWVEFEAEQARKLEKEFGRRVLCPISLDESWKTANWSPILMNQIQKYNILDFSGWKEPAEFENKFRRLLEGLALFHAADEE